MFKNIRGTFSGIPAQFDAVLRHLIRSLLLENFAILLIFCSVSTPNVETEQNVARLRAGLLNAKALKDLNLF